MTVCQPTYMKVVMLCLKKYGSSFCQLLNHYMIYLCSLFHFNFPKHLGSLWDISNDRAHFYVIFTHNYLFSKLIHSFFSIFTSLFHLIFLFTQLFVSATYSNYLNHQNGDLHDNDTQCVLLEISSLL